MLIQNLETTVRDDYLLVLYPDYFPQLYLIHVH